MFETRDSFAADMPDYELLLGNKENSYRGEQKHRSSQFGVPDFHRYRLSAFYYLTVLIVAIFLIANFLSYNPDGEARSSSGDFNPSKNVMEKKSDEEIAITTTQTVSSGRLLFSLCSCFQLPSGPYDYGSLPPCDLSEDSQSPFLDTEQIITEFGHCANMILMRFSRNPEGLLFNWPYTIYVCDEEDAIMKIPLKSFDNGEKQYWGLLPRCVS